MSRRWWPGWNAKLGPPLWLLVLAVLPWWVGLSLLLAIVLALVLLEHPLAEHAASLRRSLRWGLPGMLFALQRALGGDVFAWGTALLGVLAGYTLLVGLEAWLDRHKVVRSAAAADAPEWAELALAPIGPPVEIIELQPPCWQSSVDGLTDPRGGVVSYREGNYGFADGTWIGAASTQAGFSPDGRWFIARMGADRGIVLWDRQRDRRHRLSGWQLCGWHREQPWLNRGGDSTPLMLYEVLGEDEFEP